MNNNNDDKNNNANFGLLKLFVRITIDNKIRRGGGFAFDRGTYLLLSIEVCIFFSQ